MRLAQPLEATRVLWLVEVEFGGGVVRMAQDTVSVTTEAGDVLRFEGVLPEMDLEITLSDPGGYQSAPSMPLECVWPVDVAALVAAGHPLIYARAWVSRWVEGTTYEERQVIIAGRVEGPTYGASGDPTACTIALPPWQSTAMMPPSKQSVSGFTFADEIVELHQDLVGRYYPVVYGSPGQVSTDVHQSGRRSATRARWCDVRAGADGTDVYEVRAIIAGHHVDVERVYVYDPDGSSARCLVRNGVDDLGQPIAYLPWFAESTPAGAPDDDFDGGTYAYSYAISDFDSATTHGIGDASLPEGFNTVVDGYIDELFIAWLDDEDADRGGLSGAAGDVVVDLLRRMRLPVDAGRWAAAAPLLVAFRFDFAIDERVSPWEVLTTHVLPLLPVSLVTGPAGVYPVVWQLDATPAMAVERLVAYDPATDTGDPLVERLGPVETETDDLINEITFRYARSARTGQLGARRTFGAGPYDSDDPRTLPHPLFAASRRRFRSPDGTPLVSEAEIMAHAVCRDSTIAAAADWMARLRAFGRRRVVYAAPAARVQHVREGSIVTITDAEIGLSGAVALVVGLRYTSAPRTDLTLLLVGAEGRLG